MTGQRLSELDPACRCRHEPGAGTPALEFRATLCYNPREWRAGWPHALADACADPYSPQGRGFLSSRHMSALAKYCPCHLPESIAHLPAAGVLRCFPCAPDMQG